MHKVRKAMASSGQHPITGDCEVGEAFVGEKVSGKRGLRAEKKKKVSVVIEKGERWGLVELTPKVSLISPPWNWVKYLIFI